MPPNPHPNPKHKFTKIVNKDKFDKNVAGQINFMSTFCSCSCVDRVEPTLVSTVWWWVAWLAYHYIGRVVLCLALASEWQSVIITDFFFVTYLVLGVALSFLLLFFVLYQELQLEDPSILACWDIMAPLLIQSYNWICKSLILPLSPF